MSDTQYGRDLCATGRHLFTDGGPCERCSEPNPEREVLIEAINQSRSDLVFAEMRGAPFTARQAREWLERAEAALVRYDAAQSARQDEP